MCTAAAYKTKDFYFGRTLDNDCSYDEKIAVMPRRFPLSFGRMGRMEEHFAMIGVAHIAKGYPLYYDAVNEKGLCMAGLNFVGNAVYGTVKEGKDNLAVYEFMPWILSQCKTVSEARTLLANINLVDEPFDASLPVAQLHWILSDGMESLTIESVREGLRVYENPVGILTNNPSFEQQMFQLNNYMSLSPKNPQNHFSDRLSFDIYCKGMGALGLPGDLSSQSRFVRAAFVKMNAVSGESEAESVSQFFHILGSVEQQKGCCETGEDKYETTIYTSCCNATRGIYYYTTYNNHQITAVNLFREKLNCAALVIYPLIMAEQIRWQNGFPLK